MTAAWGPAETAPKDRPFLAKATRRGWDKAGTYRIVCALWYPEANQFYIYGAGPTGHSEQWLDECTVLGWRPFPRGAK